MPDLERCVLDVPDGAILRLHVTPRASRPGLAGFHGDALRVRLAAPPVDGKANRELLGLLATLLGVPVGHLELEAGARGREKSVRVRGLPAESVRARLAAVLSVDSRPGHN